MATDQNTTNNTENDTNNMNANANFSAGFGANNANFANAQNNMNNMNNMGGFAGYGMGAGGYANFAGNRANMGFGGAQYGTGFGAGFGGAQYGANGMFNPYFASLPQPQNPYINQTNTAQGGILATLTAQKGEILKGAAIGAIATFILTNPTTQNAIFKGIAKLSSLLEMGVEELKERYEDAKAEVNEV